MTGMENFAFVMNVASLPVENCVLVPGHVLRRATRDEIKKIKQELEHLSGSLSPSLIRRVLWEGELPVSQRSPAQLSESEWRYYVLSFRGNNGQLNELETAASLSPVELEVGFTLVFRAGGGRGLVCHPDRLFHILENARMDPGYFVSPCQKDLEEIARICLLLQTDDPGLVEIKRLGQRIASLKGFPHRSALRFLGYVAVLEALLAHSPKPTDPYDSITRQIKTKIALLDNRFERRIDYAPFGNAAPEKVWGRIYEYRSRLAHGGNPEFTGNLAILGNHEQALRLVKETVKAVVRQALLEPRLLLDLREC